MRLFLTYSGFDLFKLIFPDISQTDQWTDRPSYSVAKMHQEDLIYLL